MSILYLSFDSALEPLGQSQIVKPLSLLAEQGFDVTLLTLEKDPSAWRPIPRITWKCAPYKGTLHNLRALMGLALAEKDVQLIHARSLQAVTVALAVQKTLGAKLLFDTRAYWAEQRHGQGTLNGLAYTLARGIEHAAYKRADALVWLTELAAAEVDRGICIPTLADEHELVLTPRGDTCVLGWVGSVNPDYLLDESLILWSKVAAIRKDATFHVHTQQPDAFRARLRTLNLPADGITFASTPHTDMAAALAQIDWGLMLMRSGADKNASMPTKLGEFLLAGVRPIQHGCNSEVSQWVKTAATGLSLDSLDLDFAAHQIAHGQFAPLEQGRRVALQHFSLTRGVERYAALWDHLLRNTNG